MVDNGVVDWCAVGLVVEEEGADTVRCEGCSLVMNEVMSCAERQEYGGKGGGYVHTIRSDKQSISSSSSLLIRTSPAWKSVEPVVTRMVDASSVFLTHVRLWDVSRF